MCHLPDGLRGGNVHQLGAAVGEYGGVTDDRRERGELCSEVPSDGGVEKTAVVLKVEFEVGIW